MPGALAVPGGLAGVFSQEAEADNPGVHLAAAAGCDPLALKTCLNRLSQTIEQIPGEKEKKIHLYLLWVSMGAKTFRMAGAGDDPWKEALRQAALSLRPLTAAEKAKVAVLRLRIETARDGETLNAFCERTRSAFKPQIVQALNGAGGGTLKQGQKLKIARLEPYRSGR